MSETTKTAGEMLAERLSSFETTMLLEGHGLPTWEGAELDKMVAHPAGVLLAEMMQTAIWQLQESIDTVQRESVRLAAKNSELAEAVGNGLHADVTWVEQATRDLVKAVR